MKRCALLVFAVLFLSLGSLFADDIPHDPIIDIERGTGTIGFDGTAMFTISDGSNCIDSDVQGIRSCSAITPTFGNLTGKDITSLEFDFPLTGPNQGVFSAGANSPFNKVDTVLPGFEAIYSGGDITHNCTTSEIADGVSCDPGADFKTSEFTIGFAEVLVPLNGSVTLAFSSVPDPTSTVPEPPAAALMLTGIGIIGVVRRWFWKT